MKRDFDLIRAILVQAEAAIGPLTWQGHDFLEASRSDTIWNKAKEQLVKVGGSASLEIFKAVLIQITKSQLGIP